MYIELNRGTIRNMREKLRRNRKVSIGGVIDKFKRFPQNRMPMPHDTTDNRTKRTLELMKDFAK